MPLIQKALVPPKEAEAHEYDDPAIDDVDNPNNETQDH